MELLEIKQKLNLFQFSLEIMLNWIFRNAMAKGFRIGNGNIRTTPIALENSE